MYIPISALVGLGALLLVLLVLALRRRDGRSDLTAPPPMRAVPPPRAWPAGAAPVGDLPPELVAEVRALLDQDRKIEAIKIVRQATHLGLREAKELVERM